jgi:hypothetical protein
MWQKGAKKCREYNPLRFARNSQLSFVGSVIKAMPPKGKKKGGDDADDMGLPAEGAPPIRGPEDAIQRLKEKSLLDRVAALYVGNRSGRQLCGCVACLLSSPGAWSGV